MFSGSVKKEVSSSFPRLVRFASGPKRRATDKIPVQLLRDFPGVGQRGEILRVKPAFMRNYLHHQNGAAYITKDQGPRIPVVERVVKVEEVVQAKQETPAQKDTKANKPANAGAMSLDELSNLFTTMRSSKRGSSVTSKAATEPSFEASSDVSYTISELKDTIPSTYSVELSETVTLPISKAYLSSVFFNLSGATVPQSAIAVTEKGKRVALEALEATGEYSVTISSPLEKASITRTIIVQ
ncbi:uncharacterized protein RJT20DRAFT_136745 [Scheffersomyces xylosifermentans]|uniref:uncharacterized protein n=1 Tax=Scheffersomyces xylosifermentans TaxID=1304137 RepID=UPI00315CE83A